MALAVEFRPEHLAAVGATAIACLVAVAAARLRPGGWAVWLARCLAILLAGTEVSWWVYAATQAPWSWAYSLPLHLCEAATFVAAAALWFRQRMLVELTYFWGLAGSVQALLTPDQVLHFPTFLYLQFYAGHGLIVFAATYLVFGLGITPGRGAVLRAFALTVAYTALVAIVDLATGGNYMFLRQKPAAPSLLDLMGPWPWYILSCSLLAVVLFWALDLPFAPGRRRVHATRPASA
jgi:hypothetical integral membrane protein (TIGR02206 family)